MMMMVVVMMMMRRRRRRRRTRRRRRRRKRRRRRRSTKKYKGKVDSNRPLGPNLAVCCCYPLLYSTSRRHMTAKAKAPLLPPIPPAEAGTKRKNTM